MDRQTIARPRWSDSPRAKGQQRCRLRKSLFKSAHKYGVECDADVCVILRTREDGRTFTFSTDSFDDFLPILQELDRHYPPPVKKTPADFTGGVADPQNSQERLDAGSESGDS